MAPELHALPGGFSPKKLLRHPVVTVNGNTRTATVTFTASLAKAIDISRYTYVAIRYDPVERATHFILSNDECAYGGSYTLGFNGGSSKRKNSPSRTFNVSRRLVPYLRNGRYQVQTSGEDRRLMVTIHLDDAI